jgi:hypothetical protein
MKKIKTETINKSNYDFIDDPRFDRIDRTALAQIFYFSIMFFAFGLLMNVFVYEYFDGTIFKDLLGIKLNEPLFFISVIYHVIKSLLINNIYTIIALHYSFREYTLYEGEEKKFYVYLLISMIIYSFLIGLMYFSYTNNFGTLILLFIVNLFTLLVNLPSTIYDVKRLFLY